MFFVLSAGRSGSKAVAQILSQHPLVCCEHEPLPILIRLAADRCHHRLPEDEIRAYRSSALGFIQQGDDGEGWTLLAQAVRIYPGLVQRVDTFYELALGDQPKGYRGGARAGPPKDGGLAAVSTRRAPGGRTGPARFPAPRGAWQPVPGAGHAG